MELYLIAFTVIFGLIMLLVMISDDDFIEYCNLCGNRIYNTQDTYYRAYDTETKQNIVMCEYCGSKYYDSKRYHIHVEVYRGEY